MKNNRLAAREMTQAQYNQMMLDEVNKRYRRAKTIADQWESILEASYFYAVPFRNRFYEPKEFQGDLKNSRLYDTTAVSSTKSFVSKMHNAMTPPQTQWGFLELDNYDGQLDETEASQAQILLDAYMKQVFRYIHASNFDVSINECYFDLGVGTAGLVCNSHTDEQPLLFTSMPIDRLAIEESLDGRIGSWYRTWEDVKISELHMRWPNAVIPPNLLADMASEPSATIDKVYEGCVMFPSDKKAPYRYMVWCGDQFLVNEPKQVNPGIVWRFQKVNCETWGRGPIMEALPSIISLNEMARVELASANLNTFRPYMAFSDGVFNPHTFRLQPFTIIPIQPVGTDGQVPLIPLGDSSNPQFGEMKIMDLRQQVKTLLFDEDVNQSESIQPQTATELVIKQQKLANQIGPLFSRLQQEFLAPLINTVTNILEKRGLVRKPELNGKKIIFKYKSPLEASQGQQEIAVFTQYVQLMQGIVGPEFTNMYINPAKMPYLIAEKLQIDMELLNAPEQVVATMQSLQQQMIAQQEAAAQQGVPPEEIA